MGSKFVQTSPVSVGPLIPIQLSGLQVSGFLSATVPTPPVERLTVTALCSVLGVYTVTITPGTLTSTSGTQITLPAGATPPNGEDFCSYSLASDTTPSKDVLRFALPPSSGITYGTGPAITFTVKGLPTVAVAGVSTYIELIPSAALPANTTLSLSCSQSGVQALATVMFHPGDILHKTATYTAPPSSGLIDHCQWRMVTTSRTIGTPSSFQVRSVAPVWAKALGTNRATAQRMLTPLVLDQRAWVPTVDATGCFFDDTLVELVYTSRIQSVTLAASYAVTPYSLTFDAAHIDTDVNLASISCSAAPCTLSFVSIPLKFALAGDLLLESTSLAELYVGPIWLMAHPVDEMKSHVVTTVTFQHPDLTTSSIRASVDHLFFVRPQQLDANSDIDASEQAGQPFVYHPGTTTDFFGETGELSFSGSFAVTASSLQPGQQLWWISVSTGLPAVSVLITDVQTVPGVLAVAQVPIGRQGRPIVDGLIGSASVASALTLYSYFMSHYPQYWVLHPDFGAPLQRIALQVMGATLGHVDSNVMPYFDPQAALATYATSTN